MQQQNHQLKGKNDIMVTPRLTSEGVKKVLGWLRVHMCVENNPAAM